MSLTYLHKCFVGQGAYFLFQIGNIEATQTAERLFIYNTNLSLSNLLKLFHAIILLPNW